MALGLSPAEIVKKGTYPLLGTHPEWSRVPLSKVADVLNGYAFDASYFNNASQGKPLIRIRDIGKGNNETFYNGPWSQQYLVKNGEILIGMDGDFNCAKWHGGEALLNQRVCKIIPKSGVFSPEFLFYLLQPYLNAINAETSSVTVKHLSSKTIQQIPLPNPPLPVQHQIVARIEELFSELDAGVNELKTALSRLKTYRQAVLHHYLNNPDWERVKLGEIASVTGGITKNSKRDTLPLKVPYLRVANVYSNRLDLTEVKEIGVTEAEIQRAILKFGDLLVVEGNGSIEQVGRVALWKEEISYCLHQNHLIKIRFANSDVSKFLLTWLISPLGRKAIEEQASSTSGLHTLSISKIAGLVIPFPDLTSQAQIVSEIEARLSEADAMEATIQQELARAENLRQSILKQAFEGKLVPSATYPATQPDVPNVPEVAEPAPSNYGGKADQLTLF